jgi:hypothetical protein
MRNGPRAALLALPLVMLALPSFAEEIAAITPES